MKGFALTLCRVFALLASFVCAGGFATSAYAQTFQSDSTGADEALCPAPQQHGDSDADFGSGTSGSDFAEQDDDDDCDEEPPALVVELRPERSAWEPGRPQRAFACAPIISDHSTLEPRPPRQI